mgnify:CR=1 FL=1
MSIEKFLKTPEGALKVREKLDNMTLEEKAKPSFEKVSSMTNKALIDFGLKSKRKPRKISKEKREETFKELQALMPERFDLEKPKPLEIGSGETLFKNLEGKLSKIKIRIALRWFCKSKNYFIAIFTDKKRYDLEGNFVSDIEKEHIKKAKNDFIDIFGLKAYKKAIE